MSRHEFVEPVTGRTCTLVNQPPLGWWQGGVGVAHPECDRLTGVSPDLDSVYCTDCGFNGRISGAWVMDVRRSEDWAVSS